MYLLCARIAIICAGIDLLLNVCANATGYVPETDFLLEACVEILVADMFWRWHRQGGPTPQEPTPND